MGKVRAGNQRANAAAAVEQRPQSTRSPVDLSELESNMNSLEENKRIQACELFAYLTRINSHAAKVMEKLTSRKLLSKFVMRLVDHSLKVKSAAFRALQTVSSVSDASSMERIISCGIFRTVLAIACEPVATEDPQYSIKADIRQSALYITANIVSSLPSAVQEIVDHKADFVDLLHACLSAADSSTLNTSLNVLSVLARVGNQDRLIQEQLGLRTVSAVQQLLQHLLTGKVQVTGSDLTVVVDTAAIVAEPDAWIMAIQCIEVLSYLYLNPATTADVAGALQFHQFAQLVFQLLGLVSQYRSEAPTDPSLTVESALAVAKTRVVDMIEMLSEWISSVSQKIVAFVQEQQLTPSASRVYADRLHAAAVSLCATGFAVPSLLPQSWLCLKQQLQCQALTPAALDAYLSGKEEVAGTVMAEDETSTSTANASTAVRSTTTTKADVIARPLPSNYRAAKFVFTHEAPSTLQALEKALMAFQDLSSLFSELIDHASSTGTAHPVAWTVDWEPLGNHAAFLLEALENTTVSLDAESRMAVESWLCWDEEALSGFKSSVQSQCVQFFAMLSTLLRLSRLESASVTAVSPAAHPLVIQETMLRNFGVMLLQWLAVPQLEILLAVVQTIVVFSGEAWMSATSGPILPVNLLVLWSNGLVNRLRQGGVFSSLAAPSSSGVERSFTKQQNLARSRVLLAEACLHALIDLHSSDHVVYHTDVFMKLQLDRQLQEAQGQLIAQMNEHVFLFDHDEREALEEICANVDAFLHYKRDNFR